MIISESLTCFYAKTGRGRKRGRKSIFLNLNPSSRCWGCSRQSVQSNLPLTNRVIMNYGNRHLWPLHCRVADTTASDTFSLGHYNPYAAKVSETFTVPGPNSQNIFPEKDIIPRSV